jgi:release factor glutamine methyltransferase
MAVVNANTPLTARRALQLGTENLLKAGIESARLDMSLLLAEAMGTDRLGLYTDLDRPLTETERLAARGMLARRLRREPVAYILGRREFFGLTFEVSPRVLIPRPETELLVEILIEWLDAQTGRQGDPLLVDVGTGSGVIAVAVAHARRATRWIATDIAPDALAVAMANALCHGVSDRIDYRTGSLLDPIHERADAIVSNPPYIAEVDRPALALEIIQYEPPQALFSGPDGLDHIRRLIAGAPARLRPGGLLCFECGAGQAARILALLGADPNYREAAAHADLAGIDRVITARRVSVAS